MSKGHGENMAFGNVNIKYKPCKSVGQLKSAEKYMLGKRHDQIKAGVVKTAPDLYSVLGCSRDNFANNVLVTRKLHGKSYGKNETDDVIAHKLSISFHPNDNHKLNYHMAFEIAQRFAEKFIAEKGHEVLFAVHTDTPHKHVHFLISNCNMSTGKAYRRNKKDLWGMSKYFGEQCLEYGLVNSVRDAFYNHEKDNSRNKITLPERKMAERGKDSFKEELREVVSAEVANPVNRTFDDVVRALRENWNVECRVAGNTISYRHPEFKNKNNELVSVRGSRLGDAFTRKGIEYELDKKSITRQSEYISNADNDRTITTAEVNSECEIGKNLDYNSINARTQFTGLRGQTQSNIDVRNDEPNLRSVDSFYERYRKPIKDDEQPTIANLEPPKRVRSKGAR
ncbi:MAG: relaxase/mobilization nuclease domain-containing protein [Oscillospiraceae bacterium]|nr:relaxase/mobilization nuclease domain-containing protein [Oscillospiraceae bacterium]